ncbi:MAG TPA: VWA domain-containing protein [Bryobacteraceae bacterium]|nr:VWA domain-containing protein [Bryobacteraceae bacterium]
MFLRYALCPLIAICFFGQSPAFGQSPGSTAQKPDVAPASANANQPPAAPPIQVQVNEVIVPVTVTDDRGRFVSDLEQKDFTVFDEGKEQQIQFFTRERSQPVVVGFLIDLSNSSRLHWKNYQDAAIELVQNLIPGDNPKFSGYLIGYSNSADLLIDTGTDPEPMVAKLQKIKPSGGAALYDSIYMACTSRKLIQGEPIEPRRILVIVGDGHDNASKKTLDEALEIAQRNLVTIYGVSTTAFGFGSESEKDLTRLAEETGGRVEYPLEGVYKDVAGYLSTPSDEGNYALKVGTGQYAAELANGMYRAVEAVVGEVTTQYIIRYIPNASDAKKQFRNIDVKVNLANVKVRARKGYYPFAAQ